MKVCYLFWRDLWEVTKIKSYILYISKACDISVSRVECFRSPQNKNSENFQFQANILNYDRVQYLSRHSQVFV